MQPQNPNTGIDLNVVDQVIELIPQWTWSVVKQTLINQLVNSMPTDILEKLTGDPTGDDLAQEMLDDYYRPDELNKDLIVDSFRILGQEQTLCILEGLNLEQYQEQTVYG